MGTIIITILIISSITGSLAFLLSIANRTIGNYGEKTLIVNDEKSYTVDGGDTLISVLCEGGLNFTFCFVCSKIIYTFCLWRKG